MDKNEYDSLDNLNNLNDETLEILANKIAVLIANIFKNIENTTQNVVTDESDYPDSVSTLEPEVDLEKDVDIEDELPAEVLQTNVCTCDCEHCKTRQIYPATVYQTAVDNTPTPDDISNDYLDYYEEKLDRLKLECHLLELCEIENTTINRGGKENILYVNNIDDSIFGALKITFENHDIVLPKNEDGTVTLTATINDKTSDLQFKPIKAINQKYILQLAV